MKITMLQIDSQKFYLDDTQDVDSLQEQIVEAASTSAAFVHFDTIGHGRVSVLVTQRLGVRFEIQERTEEELAEWEAHPPVVDAPMLEL
jgi:hypothetical protein